jgi:hypothetical protein
MFSSWGYDECKNEMPEVWGWLCVAKYCSCENTSNVGVCSKGWRVSKGNVVNLYFSN